MRARLITATLIATAAATPAAHAATDVVVRGAGFGHGIGLSQYGAYGYAQNGFSFKSILGRYYRGTGLSTAPSRPVRVLLQASDPYVRVRGASEVVGGKRLDPSVTYKAVATSAGGVKLTGDGKTVGTYPDAITLQRPGQPQRLMGRAINGVNSGLYRGAMVLSPSSLGGVSAINSLPLDTYVKGVMSGEMPASWSTEALKAQAVAARTYALATRKSGGTFDQYPDTRSQVYLGVAAEDPRTNAAVASTARQIVTYSGTPAVTYFFSTSGGRTENVENSFVGSDPKPWLKSQSDPYDGISPKHRWRLRFSAGSLGARLGARGDYQKVRVIQRGVSPRIVRARIYGSGGTKVLTGPQIRARLGLYDTWADFNTVSTSQVRSKKGARAASAFPVIGGTFDPAPRGRELVVERRAGRGWKRVGTTQTTGAGRYSTTVSVPGVYRVRVGSVTGPAVRVTG